MKIGILVPSLYIQKRFIDSRISAPIKLAIALSQNLVQLGHDVTLFAGPDIDTSANLVTFDEDLLQNDYQIDYQQDIPKGSYKTTALYERKKFYELGATINAYEYAIGHDIDLMHVYHAQSNLAHFVQHYYRIPTCYTIHNSAPTDTTLSSWLLKKYANHNFIAISQSQKRTYKDLVPNLNVVDTIYHGINPDTFTFSTEGNDALLYVGRMIEEKGPDVAFDTAIKMNKRLQVLTWINEVISQSDFYKNAIANKITSQLLTVHNLVDESKKVEIYGHSKALLFPLKWSEPFGMTLIESMATGTPVIAYANGSIPEIVKDGETGYLVNMDDDHIAGDWQVKKTGQAGLIEAIERLYHLSEEQYRRMRKNCRSHVEASFTEQIMAQHHVDLYTSLTSSK